MNSNSALAAVTYRQRDRDLFTLVMSNNVVPVKYGSGVIQDHLV